MSEAVKTPEVVEAGMVAKFGDFVRCYIPGHGTPASEHYVIGHPHYSPDQRVVVLADEGAHGVPVNVDHCTVLSSGHQADCRRWRSRFERLYPGFLIDAALKEH